MSITYANGDVPPSLLAPLDGQPEASLRADAAAAWNAARAEVKRRTGITLRVRGWNRSRAEQERFFFERYEPRRTGGTDVRWYRGVRYVRVRGAAAAIPGTSNHGWGLAIDIEDFGGVDEFDHPRRLAAFPILAAHGWTDTEGRGAIREPWHLVYNPAHDAYRVSRPIPGAGVSITKPTIPGAPAPLTPRGPFMALSDTQQQQMYDALVGPNGAEHMQALMPFGQNIPTSLAALRGAVQPLITDLAPVERVIGGKVVKVALRQEIADAKTAIAAQAGQIAGLTAALGQVARGEVDLDAIREASRQGFVEAIESIEKTETTTLTVKKG